MQTFLSLLIMLEWCLKFRQNTRGIIFMGFLANKKILIVGLLSNRSIAYGIAKAMHREGADLAFTFQGERVRDRVVELAAEFGSRLVLPCDVASDAEIDAL